MTFSDVSWLLSIVSPPTASATARSASGGRSSLGCRAVRDGAYPLLSTPQHDHALRELANECIRGGGNPWQMVVLPRSTDEAAAYRQVFDRRKEYAELCKTWRGANGGIPSLATPGAGTAATKIATRVDEPMPESCGFEAVPAGARERPTDVDDSDDALLGAMSHVLDSPYAHFQRHARQTGDTGLPR